MFDEIVENQDAGAPLLPAYLGLDPAADEYFMRNVHSKLGQFLAWGA